MTKASWAQNFTEIWTFLDMLSKIKYNIIVCHSKKCYILVKFDFFKGGWGLIGNCSERLHLKMEPSIFCLNWEIDNKLSNSNCLLFVLVGGFLTLFRKFFIQNTNLSAVFCFLFSPYYLWGHFWMQYTHILWHTCF